MKKSITLTLLLCLLIVVANAQNYGINTTIPLNTLDVAGTVRVRGGAPAAGKVLTSDANGTGSWQTRPTTPKIAFKTKGLIDYQPLVIPSATWTKVVFNNVPEYNMGWGYQGAAGVFEAPVRGIYHFDVRLDSQEFVSEYWLRLMLNRGGVLTDVSLTHYKYQPSGYSRLSWYDLTMNLDIWAEPGDDFWVEIYCNSAGAVISPAHRANWFSGHLVKAM